MCCIYVTHICCIYVTHICCIYVTHMIHICDIIIRIYCRIYTTYETYMHHICFMYAAYMFHIWCIYEQHIEHVWYIDGTYMIRIWNIYVTYMQHICIICDSYKKHIDVSYMHIYVHICPYMCIYETYMTYMEHIWKCFTIIYDSYMPYMNIYGHIWPYMQIYMWHIWHIWENICLNIYATYMSTYKMSYMFRIFFHIWNIYACSVWAVIQNLSVTHVQLPPSPYPGKHSILSSRLIFSKRPTRQWNRLSRPGNPHNLPNLAHLHLLIKSWPEARTSPGFSTHAFPLNLAWLRLNPLHDAKVFLLVTFGV